MSEQEFENEDYGLTEDQLALLETTDIPDGRIDYSQSNGQEDLPVEEVEEQQPENEAPESDEPKEEEKVEETDQKNDDRKVPLSALHQEREQRRQWRDKANELQGQLNLIMQSLQSGGITGQNNAQKEPEQVYDPKTHPLEYIQQQMSQFQEAKRQMDEFNRAQAQAIQQKQIEEQVVTTWSKAVEEQKVETPDVEDATKYLIETRSSQLRAFGLAPAQIEQQLRSEVIQLVAQGRQMGVNPAKMAFEMAVASGYRNNASAPVQESKVKEAANQIKNAEKARKANRTLAAVSGAPANDEVTLEVLDQMSEREFTKWIEKHPREYERILMNSF